MLRSMNIGAMDRRVTIQAKADTQSADGLPVETWTNAYTNVPAQRKYGTGGEKEDEGQQVNHQKADYICKYVSGITTEHRIVEGSLVYEIESIEEIGRRQGLLLKTQYNGLTNG